MSRPRFQSLVLIAIATVSFTATRAETLAPKNIERLPSLISPAIYGPYDVVVRGQESVVKTTFSSHCDKCRDSGCHGGCVAKRGRTGVACATCGRGDHMMGLWRNSTFTIGADGWGNKADDDDNNNFGVNYSFNTAFNLRPYLDSLGMGGRRPVGVQTGVRHGVYNFYGREDGIEATAEQQVFVTFGAFQRSDPRCNRRCSAGLVFDYLFADNWGEEADRIDLYQLRGQVGYALTNCHEVGLSGSFRLNDDTAENLGVAPSGTTVSAMDQYLVYWQQCWKYGGTTRISIGTTDDRFELGDLVFGVSGHAPLSDCVAVYGNFHYVNPSTVAGDVGNNYSEQTWNVSFGLAFYLGGRSVWCRDCGPAVLPLLPVADNSTFMVGAPTGDL